MEVEKDNARLDRRLDHEPVQPLEVAPVDSAIRFQVHDREFDDTKNDDAKKDKKTPN